MVVDKDLHRLSSVVGVDVDVGVGAVNESEQKKEEQEMQLPKPKPTIIKKVGEGKNIKIKIIVTHSSNLLKYCDEVIKI